MFDAEDETLGRGYVNMLSLTDKKKLTIKVEVKVVEVGHEGDVTGRKTINVNGFQVLHRQISQEHKIYYLGSLSCACLN